MLSREHFKLVTVSWLVLAFQDEMLGTRLLLNEQSGFEPSTWLFPYCVLISSVLKHSIRAQGVDKTCKSQ